MGPKLPASGRGAGSCPHAPAKDTCVGVTSMGHLKCGAIRLETAIYSLVSNA